MNQLKLKSATSGKHKILSPVDLENKKLWLQKEGILSDYGLGIQGYFHNLSISISTDYSSSENLLCKWEIPHSRGIY